jgi:low affinity Fe/Cu permease
MPLKNHSSSAGSSVSPAPSAPSGYRWFARLVARQSGRPQVFSSAVLLVALWLGTGPLFGFSDTWQLVINTATTIITFLMVFVIQNTQNRDTEALQIKLDELIRATQGANTTLLDLEEMAEQQLDQLHAHYEALAQLAREELAEPPA